MLEMVHHIPSFIITEQACYWYIQCRRRQWTCPAACSCDCLQSPEPSQHTPAGQPWS